MTPPRLAFCPTPLRNNRRRVLRPKITLETANWRDESSNELAGGLIFYPRGLRLNKSVQNIKSKAPSCLIL